MVILRMKLNVYPLLALRRKLRVFFYYLTKLPLVYKSIFITPDRYLTIAGIILALYGLDIILETIKALQLKDEVLNLSTIFSNDRALIKSWIAVFVLGFTLFVAPYCSFFLTRKNTADFTKVLSNATTTDQLIRHLAFEARCIVRSINKHKTSQGIKKEINLMRNTLRTVESLKGVLAKRLMISPRDLSDDFLKFSATVYINRQIYRAAIINKENYNKARNLDSFHIDTVDYIQNYSKVVEDHLDSLVKTDLDLSEIEYMFQTRSVSTVTQHLVSMLDIEYEKLVKKEAKDLKLLVELSKAHRTGVAIYRGIGLAIMIYIEHSQNAVDLYQQRSLDAKLIDRIKSLTGSEPEKGQQSLVGWYLEVQQFTHKQRETLRDRIRRKLLKKIKKLRKLRGTVYIVIPQYSRVIRIIVNSIVARDKKFKDVRIVISVENETQNDFGPRLMFHHITNEQTKNNQNLSERTWRSTPEALVSRIDEKRDHIIFLCGCDRIGVGNSFRPEHKISKSRSKKHRHMNKAHLTKPMSLAKKFQKTKRQKIDVIVVAGNYKYDLDILIDELDKHKLPIADEVRLLVPKPRRAGLHQWKTEKNIEVQVVSAPLIPRTLNRPA